MSEKTKRTPSAYNNFIKDFFSKYKSNSSEHDSKKHKKLPKDIICMAALVWKELSDAEKAKYKTIVQEKHQPSHPSQPIQPQQPFMFTNMTFEADTDDEIDAILVHVRNISLLTNKGKL